MAFRVGMNVECIWADGMHYAPMNYSGRLVLGAKYTIRGVDLTQGTTVWLEEIVGTISRVDGREIGFYARRFRPVVSTGKGMAILEQIRRDVTNKELRPSFEDEQV